MSNKFQNKYRIASTRLQTWDYGSNAAYFVTLCTKNRKHYFGNITVQSSDPGVSNVSILPDHAISNRLSVPTASNDSAIPRLQLSKIGQIAYRFWNEIPSHFSFIELGEFVVMPNHIHGILIINKKEPILMPDHMRVPNSKQTIALQMPESSLSIFPDSGSSARSQSSASSETSTKQTAAASKKWKSSTLGVIINQYKRICTIHARKINPHFAWQSLYHDHIIRNERAFQNISHYIRNNPSKWLEDKFRKK